MNDKRILITGGTGSWGRTLTTKLLHDYDPKEIVIFSRGELQQVNMQREYNNERIKYVIGDIRDYDAVNAACKNIDIIFHLAALKHVPVCETYPHEAIKTNVNGTTNVINAAINNNVKTVIDVSTDKACEPNNVYGMTKSIAERLIINANNINDYTNFTCVRGGNVIGSNGSVIPHVINTVRSGGPVHITDFNMTRFFLSLNDAIELLFRATKNSIGGEIFVMKMPSCFIYDLVMVLLEDLGVADTMKVLETGIRPGEKINEVLVTKHEMRNTYKYDDEYFVVLPTTGVNRDYSKYTSLDRVNYTEFSSETNTMSPTDIRRLIHRSNVYTK